MKNNFKVIIFLCSMIIFYQCSLSSELFVNNRSSEAKNFLFNGIEFVKIKEGIVTAGARGSECPKDSYYEEDVFEISIPAFFISKTEVTNAQYKKFCDATGRKYPGNPDFSKEASLVGKFPENPYFLKLDYKGNYFIDYPDYPVVMVSYYDAEECSKWYGFRLPDFYEWEKCCKSGSKYADFPWGTCENLGQLVKITKYANVVGSSPVKVMSYRKNSLGIYDICGNVAEWVSGFPMHNRKAIQNKGPELLKIGIFRGGSFDT